MDVWEAPTGSGFTENVSGTRGHRKPLPVPLLNLRPCLWLCRAHLQENLSRRQLCFSIPLQPCVVENVIFQVGKPQLKLMSTCPAKVMQLVGMGQGWAQTCLVLTPEPSASTLQPLPPAESQTDWFRPLSQVYHVSVSTHSVLRKDLLQLPLDSRETVGARK